MAKLFYKKSFLCTLLVILYFALALCEKTDERAPVKANVPEKRDSSVKDSSSYLPPSSDYAAPQSSTYGAPAKPTKNNKVQKFKLIVVLVLMCLMTLGVVWTFVRVFYLANLGAAGTTRSLLSTWNSYSMLPDWEWASLASKVLDSDVLPGILEAISNK